MRLGFGLDEALLKASPVLQKKMLRSVELIRKAEKLSLTYDDVDGFFLAFSGGKDSQALYHITELAGVKFKAHFSPTTVDPPQLIRFIRKSYPDCEFGKVTKNIYDMAVEKQILPTMRVRWCCAEYKEMAGAGKVTLIGIRHAESARRAKRNEVEISNRKFSGNFEQFTEWQEERIRKKYKNLNQDQFSYDKTQEVRCINGKDSILVSPIIDWTEADVSEFLNKVCEIPHCELYDKGYRRIGCILCPMASYKQKKKECRDFPYVKEKWIDAIKKIRMGGGIYTREYIWWGIRKDGSTDRNGRRTHTRACKARMGAPKGVRVQDLSYPDNGYSKIQIGGANLEKDSPKSNSTFPNDGYPSGSAGICEKTEEYGKTVDCPTMGTIPNEELENQIAENIFDWWISGESYEKWYADKFLQQRIDFDEE